MSTAAGEDILSWLDDAISTAQAKAEETAGLGTCPNWGRCTPDCVHPDGIGVNNSESVLRRCAADRKILALHRPDRFGDCVRTWSRSAVSFPCPTILALAEGYGWTGGDR